MRTHTVYISLNFGHKTMKQTNQKSRMPSITHSKLRSKGEKTHSERKCHLPRH